MDYRARQTKFAAAVEESRVDGFLVTHLPNVRYLCGFTGSAGVLAHAKGKFVFFSDGRYREQARQEVTGATVIISRKPALIAAAEWLCGARVRRLGIEAEHMSLAARAAVTRPFQAALRPMVGLIERLRMIKEPAELECIRRAVQLGSSLFSTALEAICPGVTEAAVAAELEYAARAAGAEKMSFESIVAAGAHSALPHWRASSQLIPNTGFVVFDFGVILAGYCSDMTRTVWLGKPKRGARDLYQAVFEAQMAGVAAVRPGATTGEVDAAARSVLRRAKLGRYFTHSTGHGVGLEIHEAPRLARGQTEVLRPGMVVTIEPGVYIPRQGGVRIEDMVAVTDSGHQVLTPTTKEFIAVPARPRGSRPVHRVPNTLIR